MFNLVELLADREDIEHAPCKFGNIVVGHACYCHADHWEAHPRKRPLYWTFGSDKEKWHNKDEAGGCQHFVAIEA